MISPDSSDKYIPRTEDSDVDAERQEYLAETHMQSFQFGAGRSNEDIASQA